MAVVIVFWVSGRLVIVFWVEEMPLSVSGS